MIHFNTITLRNFLSVGAVAQTVALNAAPLTLLLGANMDVGGENSRNGAGKSTLLQAICYALYGDPLTKIKVDNLVNSVNEKELFVAIDFVCDGVPYRIERGRKPNLLRFLVGNERQDVAKGTNDKTQIEIERIIGMTHTMFLHVVALNTFTLPFLKMRPADQREIIEELMGITQLSLHAEHLKEVSDATKYALRDEEAMIKATLDANARITSVIEHTKQQADEWAHQQDVTISDIETRVAKLLEVDIDAELSVFDAIDKWQSMQVQSDAEISTAQSNITTLHKTIEHLTYRLSLYEKDAFAIETDEIKRLKQHMARLRAGTAQDDAAQRDRLQGQASRQRGAMLSGKRRCEIIQIDLDAILKEQKSPDTHHCTTCGQDLAGTHHLEQVIAKLETKRKSLIVEYERIDIEANMAAKDALAIERDIESLTIRRQEANVELETQIADAARDIERIERINHDARIEAEKNAQTLRYEIAERRNELAGHQQNIEWVRQHTMKFGEKPISRWESRDALYAARQERDKLFLRLDMELDRGNPYQEKINGLTFSLLPINYDRMNDLTMQQKHEQFLYKLLTSKDSFIRKRIIDQNLSYLNKCLNRYLQRLGLPHEVRFLPDLTVEITLSGRDFDFEQLSRGEMNRLILSTSWSFRELWESLNTDFNLMFCDEVLDQGTDEAGVEAAVEVLMQLARERHKNILLISHRESLRTRIDRVLIARKVDSFTSFAEEAD